MHKTKQIIIVILALTILALQSTAQNVEEPWYKVSPWEINVCSKWGGRTTSQQNSFQEPTSYGDVTITLQGRKRTTINETLYEITYYIQSNAVTTDYKIILNNPSTSKTKEITHGSLGPSQGATDYWTQYLPDKYTHLTLTYYKGSITIPLIEA